MSWNYRVCKRTYDTINGRESLLAIHEVYYEDKNKSDLDLDNVTSFSSEAISVTGDDTDDILATLDMMHDALDKPVIDLDDLEVRLTNKAAQEKDEEPTTFDFSSNATCDQCGSHDLRTEYRPDPCDPEDVEAFYRCNVCHTPSA